MTELEIDQVERALSVRLPSDVRSALLARGEEQYGPFSADAFIASNSRRRSGTVLNNVNDEPWPAHFLYVGGDGSGHTTYFVRTDVDPSGVWECSHEEVGGVRKRWGDVAGMLDRLIE